MIHPALPLLLALLCLPAEAQGFAPEDAKVMALSRARDWPALAAHIDSLPPKDRGRHLMAWVSALSRSGQHARSVEVCDSVLDQLRDHPEDPQVAFALEFKARGLGQLGRPAEAGALWEQLAQRPGRALDYQNAIVEYRNAQDWPAMARSARPLLQAVPGLAPSAKAWLGEALARQEQWTEAEPLLREALAAQPKQPYAWTNLARCLNERKAWQEALDACTEALAQEPRQPEALYNRGRSAFELKQYPQAIQDFQAALGFLPADATLLANLHQAQRYADTEAKGKKNKK